MKKNLFMVAAVALMALVSCNKEVTPSEEIAPVGETVTFEASVDGAETKTVLEGNKSFWIGEEWIQVVGSKAYWFGSEKLAEKSTRALFSYNGNNGEYKEGAVMAAYPAGSVSYVAKLDTKTLSGVSVETSQTAVKGTYDCDGALMVAYAEEGEQSFAFKNVPALLKFTMGSENISKVTVWGTLADGTNAVLSGKGSVAYNNGDPIFTPDAGANGGKTYVELVCDSKFEKGQVYYIAILPTEFKSITVEFDGFTAKSKEFENPYVISRNKIVDLGIIETSSTGRVIAGLGGVWEVNKGVPFVEGENYYEAKNVTIAATDKFKIYISGTWLTATMKTGEWITLKDGGDATLSAGTYDFYLTKNENKLHIVTSGSNEPAAPGVIVTKEGYLYLKPNANWLKDGARFAAYFFGNGETWVSMKDLGNGYYEVQKPTSKSYPNVIFCRMNPGATANNWNNKWNQTADLTVPTDDKNLYTVKENTWDKGGGTWDKKDQF